MVALLPFRLLDAEPELRVVIPLRAPVDAAAERLTAEVCFFAEGFAPEGSDGASSPEEDAARFVPARKRVADIRLEGAPVPVVGVPRDTLGVVEVVAD